MTVTIMLTFGLLLALLLLLLFSKRADVPMWMHAPSDDDSTPANASHEASGRFSAGIASSADGGSDIERVNPGGGDFGGAGASGSWDDGPTGGLSGSDGGSD